MTEETNQELKSVLEQIAEEFKEEINPSSSTYCLIDLGKASMSAGKPGLKKRYEGVNAIIPLRRAKGKIGFQVDGSDLSDYVQLDSGLVVEQYVAKEAGMKCTNYQPKKHMILV